MQLFSDVIQLSYVNTIQITPSTAHKTSAQTENSVHKSSVEQ